MTLYLGFRIGMIYSKNSQLDDVLHKESKSEKNSASIICWGELVATWHLFREIFDGYAWIVQISQLIKDEWSHIVDISVPLENKLFSIDQNQVKELNARKYFDIVCLLDSNKHYALWMVKGIYFFHFVNIASNMWINPKMAFSCWICFRHKFWIGWKLWRKLLMINPQIMRTWTDLWLPRLSTANSEYIPELRILKMCSPMYKRIPTALQSIVFFYINYNKKYIAIQSSWFINKLKSKSSCKYIKTVQRHHENLSGCKC